MGNPSLRHQCNEFAGLIWSLIPSPKGPAQTAPVGGDNPWALSREGTGTEGPQAAAPPAAPAVSSLHLPFHIHNITLMPTKREQALPAAAARAVPAPRHLRPPAPRRGPFGGLAGGFTAKHITLGGEILPRWISSAPRAVPRGCWRALCSALATAGTVSARLVAVAAPRRSRRGSCDGPAVQHLVRKLTFH